MDPKPRDFTTPKAAIELTRERMLNSVTHGRPGTAMMAHEGRLSQEQIVALVDYIREKFMRIPDEQLDEEGNTVVQAVSTPLDSPILVTGEKIYTANCSVCHGDKGNTAFWAKNGLNPPPRNFTGQKALSTLTKARMINSVTHGRPGTGMMPFNKRLSGDEIRAVVTYIRAKFMGVDPATDTGATPQDQMAGHSKAVAKAGPAKEVSQPAAESKPEPSPAPQAGGIPGIDTPMPSTSTASNPHGGNHSGTPVMGMAGNSPGHVIDADMSLPIPNGLKGDVTWGRQFYMNNCFTCHGVEGNGQGPRAYFNIPRPRNFTSEASRRILNRPRVFKGITEGRVGTVMPAWGKVLTPQQIANLTEYVFTTYIHPELASQDEKKKAP
jgi:mono/diheme cytochrome c family protein